MLLCVLALVSALACDKVESGGGEAKKQDTPSEKPASEDDDAKVQPRPSEPSEPAEPSESEPASEPSVDPAPAKRTIESLAASVERVEDPSASGWAHLKAKDYATALPYFAQASLAEPSAWKHPYNLACAAALAGDHEAAQLGLAAAVARDREATANKARRDADLASVRDQPWFEPILRGKQTPSVKAKPLSKAQLDPILTQLEAKYGVRPVVRASLVHADQSGETLGWVLFGITKMDECLKTSTKAKCTAQLKGGRDIGDSDDRSCAREYVVRAQLGATLTLAEPRELKPACSAANVRRFELADVDADGKLELILDVTGRHLSYGAHEEEAIEAGREVRILRLDDTVQFELTVRWTTSGIAPGYERSQRFTLTDDNADGHADLFIETKEFVGVDYLDFDDALWLTTEVNEEDEEAVGPYSAHVRYYQLATDEWGPPVAKP